MDNSELVLLATIKSWINTAFPLLNVVATKDPVYADISIMISQKPIYYSQEYQELVSRINTDYLWPAGIFHVIFVCDEEAEYTSSFTFTSGPVGAQAVSWFYYKPDMDVSKTHWLDGNLPKVA